MLFTSSFWTGGRILKGVVRSMADISTVGAPETEILRQRIDKLNRLRLEEGYNPFENEKWEVDSTVSAVRAKYDYLKEEEAKINFPWQGV